MKIVTVNVPESYITAIEKLVGDNDDHLFPSRSELIRVAVRDFLLKELKIAGDIKKFHQGEPEVEDFDDKTYVRIPVEIEGTSRDGKPITEFKTYKILREA